jgi:ribosomal protein L22
MAEEKNKPIKKEKLVERKEKELDEIKEEKNTAKSPTEEIKDKIVSEEKKEEPKKLEKKVEKQKKTEAVVKGYNIPISTKKAAGICKFIKGKMVNKAIRDLENVLKLKKVVPMKGEYAHRKGKGISSGKYPQRASKNFIVLLKSLAANSSDINEPVIVSAVANIGVRPFGRGGRTRKKRTHLEIIEREKKLLEAKK